MPAPFLKFPLLRSCMLNDVRRCSCYVHATSSSFCLARNHSMTEVKAQVLAGGRGLGYFKEQLPDTRRFLMFFVSFFGG